MDAPAYFDGFLHYHDGEPIPGVTLEMHKWYQSQFADGEIRCTTSKDLSDARVAEIDGKDAYGFTIYDWRSIRSPDTCRGPKMKPRLQASPDGKKGSRFPIVYGGPHAPAFEFILQPPKTEDTGSLKEFVSTFYLNMV